MPESPQTLSGLDRAEPGTRDAQGAPGETLETLWRGVLVDAARRLSEPPQRYIFALMCATRGGDQIAPRTALVMVSEDREPLELMKEERAKERELLLSQLPEWVLPNSIGSEWIEQVPILEALAGVTPSPTPTSSTDQTEEDPRTHRIGVSDYESLVKCLTSNWKYCFPELEPRDPQDMIQFMAAWITNERREKGDFEK